MSVELTPSSGLGFHRPLTTLVKRSLTVGNPHDQPVVFKVKTTAPKQYCVRPNSGRVEPGDRVEVQVLLQPMKEDPPPGAKCRDKFLVQSAFFPPDISQTDKSLADIWQLIERDSKGSISEHKIRCSYLPPIDSMPPVPEEVKSDVGDSSHLDGRDQTMQSTFSSVNGGERGYAVGEDEEPQFKTVRTQINGGSYQDGLKAKSSSPSPPPAFSAFTPEPEETHITKGNGDDSSVLKKQLSDAMQEITKLKNQLTSSADSGTALRQRKVPGGGDKGQGGSLQAVIGQDAPVDGVPLQIVVGLCIGIFLFTWAFF